MATRSTFERILYGTFGIQVKPVEIVTYQTTEQIILRIIKTKKMMMMK